MNFMSYFSQSSPNQSAQLHQIGKYTVQELELISEGGFGYVWKAQLQNRQLVALKKMNLQGHDRLEHARNEIKIMNMFRNNENVIQLYESQINMNDNSNGVCLMVMELCSGGSLFDLMEQYMKTKLNKQQVLYIMKDITKGLIAMHSKGVAHRDLKIENVLLNNKKFKLCDFGSASSQVIDFSRVNRSDYQKYEEQFEQNTTMMYRPPEMCDPYLNYKVDCKVDIWMLGCILYTLLFFKHPFQESQKLAIIGANYQIPEDIKCDEKLLDLIRHLLTPDPKYRPSAQQVLDILDNYDNLKQIPLNQMARQEKSRLQQEEQRVIDKQKQFKPVKQYDGDIPMDELIKLQQKIINDQQTQKQTSKQSNQTKQVYQTSNVQKTNWDQQINWNQPNNQQNNQQSNWDQQINWNQQTTNQQNMNQQWDSFKFDNNQKMTNNQLDDFGDFGDFQESQIQNMIDREQKKEGQSDLLGMEEVKKEDNQLQGINFI